MPILSFITDLAHPYNKVGDGPEGPEVRCVGDCLRSRILGYHVTACTEHSTGTLSGFDRLPLGLMITEVRTHGKKLFLILNEGTYIIMFSLGMTGRIQFGCGRFNRATIILRDNAQSVSTEHNLYFDDARKMGHIDLFDQQEYQQYLTTLGPDLLTTDIEAEEWRAMFANRDRKICDMLVDQSLVAGIGWYIMTDALYLAKVHPTRKGKSISDSEWEQIRVGVYQVIHLSYEEGGFTIRDYITPTGKQGGYESIIYGRDVDYKYRPVLCQKYGSRTLRYVAEVQK